MQGTDCPVLLTTNCWRNAILSNTIYVDMDDVLCHTARTLITVVNREFGKRLVYEDLIAFDLGKSCGLNQDELARLLSMIHDAEELVTVPPIRESFNRLAEWERQGYRIAIVTGRPTSTYQTSLEWLARHSVPYHSFHMVNKYGHFQTDQLPALTLDELAAMHFILAVEDSLDMANYLAKRMDTPVALLDRPWNQCEGLPSRIMRCNSWEAVTVPDRR